MGEPIRRFTAAATSGDIRAPSRRRNARSATSFVKGEASARSKAEHRAGGSCAFHHRSSAIPTNRFVSQHVTLSKILGVLQVQRELFSIACTLVT